MGNFKIAKTVVKSLFKRPATLMYPVIERDWQDRTRGSIDINTENCILCGICARRCPTGAINSNRKEGLWEINRMQCIQCGACIEVCHNDCLSMEPQYTEPETEKVIEFFELPDFKKSHIHALSVEMDEKLVCNKDECIYCGLCAKNCPGEALTVDRKEKVWKVDEAECVKCGVCVDKCPKKCLGFGDMPVAKVKDDSKKSGKDNKKSDTVASNKLTCNIEDCIYCGLCAKTCACEALTVDRKEKVWKVDEAECVKCGACIEKCPKSCLSLGDRKKTEKVDKPAPTAKKANEEKEKLADKPIPVVDPGKCVYCRLCENSCPCEAISADVDDWKVDKDKCVSCGACINVCPAEAIQMNNDKSI